MNISLELLALVGNLGLPGDQIIETVFLANQRQRFLFITSRVLVRFVTCHLWVVIQVFYCHECSWNSCRITCKQMHVYDGNNNWQFAEAGSRRARTPVYTPKVESRNRPQIYEVYTGNRCGAERGLWLLLVTRIVFLYGIDAQWRAMNYL